MALAVIIHFILLWHILTDQTLAFLNAVVRPREYVLWDASSTTAFHEIHADTIAQLCQALRPRSRLKERHRRIFDPRSEHLFHRLGRLLSCDQGVVSRKEFLETFAAASAMHPLEGCRRVADLAAGHGLLSWFLLVMDDSSNEELKDDRPLTAVCIDRRMPRSAHVVETLMLHEFPHLEDRWSYIQADLSGIEPDPSCLLASVHACGTLSDSIIASAIDHRAPLALVPCCHTVQRSVYRPHPRFSHTTVEHVAAMVQQRKQQQTDGHDKYQAVADVVDGVRCRTLQNAGFRVEDVWLPEQFTARNRLIVALPFSTAPGRPEGTSAPPLPRTRRSPFPPLIRIPLADTVKDVACCNKVASLTKHSAHDPPPFKYTSLTLAVNVWLPEGDDKGQNSTVLPALQRQIQEDADRCCKDIGSSYGLACSIASSGNPRSIPGPRQQWQQLYQVRYFRISQENLRGASRLVAKQAHVALKERLGDQLVV